MRKLLLAGWCCMVWASAQASPPPQQQLNQTLVALAKSKEEQVDLAKKQASLTRELEKLQTRATELAERLQVSERRVTNEERALATVTTKLTAQQREFELRKADYTATVLSLLRMRRLPVTAFATANDEQFLQLMRTASVLEKTNKLLAKKAQALRNDMGELKELRGETTQRRKRTNAETEALLDEQKTLEKTLRERQRLQDKLAQGLQRAESRVAELSRESASLQELLGKLETEERERERERIEREKATPQPKPKEKEKPAASPSKGNLSLPVAGDVVHRFGEARGDADTYRGIVVRARSSATVIAPADGKVAFTGPFRDYGNMVLIKHRGGYISLIAGVGKMTARLHQDVQKGEPIATMGSGSPEAYIELRDSSAKPIDPAAWFANVKGKTP